MNACVFLAWMWTWLTTPPHNHCRTVWVVKWLLLGPSGQASCHLAWFWGLTGLLYLLRHNPLKLSRLAAFDSFWAQLLPHLRYFILAIPNISQCRWWLGVKCSPFLQEPPPVLCELAYQLPAKLASIKTGARHPQLSQGTYDSVTQHQTTAVQSHWHSTLSESSETSACKQSSPHSGNSSPYLQGLN